MFNEDKRTVMMWAVQQECPSGERFIFNCHHHCDTLVIRYRVGGDMGHFLYSKEKLTQGEYLAMIVCLQNSPTNLGPPIITPTGDTTVVI